MKDRKVGIGCWQRCCRTSMRVKDIHKFVTERQVDDGLLIWSVICNGLFSFATLKKRRDMGD